MPIIYPSVPNIKPTPAQNINMQLPGTKLPSWMNEPIQINNLWYLVGAGIVLFLLLKD